MDAGVPSKRFKTGNQSLQGVQATAFPSSQGSLQALSQSTAASTCSSSSQKCLRGTQSTTVPSSQGSLQAFSQSSAASTFSSSSQDLLGPSKTEIKEEHHDQEDHGEPKVSPTANELKELGILREVDYEQAAQQLIDAGKAGWRYDVTKPSQTNLQIFFVRYNLGQKSEPYDLQVTTLTLGLPSPYYQATLKADLSKKVYIAHSYTGFAAKQAVADQFFLDEDIREIMDLIPPKPADIRFKAGFLAQEKRDCRSHGASQEVMNEIVRDRMERLYAVFRDWGYRTDLWDGTA